MIDTINNYLRGVTVVEWVLISTAILILGTTIFAALHGQRTISNSLKDWGSRYNWFSFTFGSLVGHWFFPNIGVIEREWTWLLIPMILLGILDRLYNKKIISYPKWLRYPGLWVALGIVSGALLWSSNL